MKSFILFLFSLWVFSHGLHAQSSFTKPTGEKPGGHIKEYFAGLNNLGLDHNENHWLTGSKQKPTRTHNPYSDIKQQLDSLIYDTWLDDEVWGEAGKSVYTFDEFGRQTSVTEFFVSMFRTDWIPYYRYEYSYDDNGQMIEFRSFLYEENNWLVMGKILYSYDDQGNELLSVNYSWDALTENWIPSRKQEYAYNDEGSRTLYSMYDWVEDVWVADRRYLYTYNIEGLMILEEFQYWQPTIEDWGNYQKTENNYDEDGHLLEETQFYWNDEATDWDPLWKRQFFFSPEGLPTHYLDFSWENGGWLEQYKKTYEFDDNGNMVQGIDYWWSNNAWAPQYRYDYFFDEWNNIVMMIDYEWDNEFSRWAEGHRTDISYDINFTYDDLILPDLGEGSETMFQYMILDLTDFDWSIELNDWMTDEKVNFHYSETTIIGQIEKEAAEVRVFPNPASGYVVFEGSVTEGPAWVELYDTQGRKVLSERMMVNRPVNISHLSAGVYVYRFITPDQLYNGKVIVRRMD